MEKFLLQITAIVAITVICVGIGVAGFGVQLGITILATLGTILEVFIAASALCSLKSSDLRITPRLLNQLSKEKKKIEVWFYLID